MNDLKGKGVAIIVTDGFEQIEMTTLQDDLRNAGARWEDKECIRDRNWVTSRKPDDLPVFNREMVNSFAEAKQDAREVRP